MGDPLRTGIALVILGGAAFAVMTVSGLRMRRDLLISTVRALVQLTLVALVIAWIFTHPAGAFVYLAIMLVAAAFTAYRRIGGDRRDFVAVLLAIAAGSGATVCIVSITGALSFDAQTMLPFSAQMIGGAMATCAVAGVRLRDDIRDRMVEFEGYLALGASYRKAGWQFATRASERSLLPTLDQTKSAGLVALPGAFVGLLIGGASPLVAAQVQLLVLIGLVLVQSITAVITTRLINPLDYRPGIVRRTA